MPVYTMSNLLGGYMGAQMRLPTNASYTNVGFAIDCQGANGYTYVTATNPPGPNDIALTTTGNIALDGTWSLTDTRPNLGTTSLAIPSTGTTAFLAPSANYTAYLRSGAMAFWVYVDTLPAATAEIMWYTNSTGRPSNSAIHARSLGITPTGRVQFYHKQNTNITTVTSANSIVAGAWYYISCTFFMERAFVGINGAVEAFNLNPDTTTTGTTTGMMHAIRGGTGYTGIYIDDPIGYKRHVPRLSANFAVPTVEFGSLLYTGNQMTLGSSTASAANDQLHEGWAASRIYDNSKAGRSDARAFTTIARLTSIVSPAIAYLHGVRDTSGRITPGACPPGGGGSVRPTTGLLYPRKN